MLASSTVVFRKSDLHGKGGMQKLDITSQCFQPFFDPDVSTVELNHKDLVADIDIHGDEPAMPTWVSHQELFERWGIDADVDEIRAIMVPEPVVFLIFKHSWYHLLIRVDWHWIDPRHGYTRATAKKRSPIGGWPPDDEPCYQNCGKLQSLAMMPCRPLDSEVLPVSQIAFTLGQSSY